MASEVSRVLKGKSAVVCGSSKGIGLAVAQILAEQGARVALMARNREAMKKALVGLATPLNQDHTLIEADFSQEENVAQAMDKYLQANSQVDILVNNTGGPAPGPVYEADLSELRKAYSMHLLSNQVLVKAVVPSMKEGGYGRIINIISTSIREPIADLGVSNTVRGAVASWAKTLSRELGPFGITVNNILPGYTWTERLDQIIEDRAERAKLGKEEMIAQMKEQVPLKRFAEPKEIALVAAFLASPAASYVSGASLAVDGGRSASI